MRPRAMMACGIVVAGIGSAAVPARAQDQAPPAGAPAPDDQQAQGMSRWHSNPGQIERWENGLDAKLTSLFTRKASDISSPTLMLSAQWNYRMQSGTYLGFSASGMPQSNSDTDDNGVKRDFSTYYGGLNLAQSVYANGAMRGVVSAAAGRGVVYVRTTHPDGTSEIGNSPFYFVEPSFYMTFFDYSGLDIGAVLSYRMVMLSQTDRAQNSDMSSLSLGMTFRNRGF